MKHLINFPEKLIGGFLIVPKIFPCFLKYYLYCTTNTKNYSRTFWEIRTQHLWKSEKKLNPELAGGQGACCKKK